MVMTESDTSTFEKTIYAVATLAGFTLIFGSTDASPFEVIAGSTIVLTSFAAFAYRSVSPVWTKQNVLLFGFVALVLAQLLYVPEPNILYTAVTLYLIAFYGAVQFWYSRFPIIIWYALYGYLIAAIFSSVLGMAGYFGRVFGLDGLQDLFFWDSVRVSVFYADPVVYGAFLVPSLFIFAYLTSFSETKERYIIYTSITLLIFANLILSGSRGAWLNFLVGGLLLFILHRPFHQIAVIVKTAALSIVAILVAVVLIYVVPLGDRTYYAATMEYRYQASDGPRLAHLQTVPMLILDRSIHEIILGSGSGQYERASVNGFSAHNLYLRLLYEQGVLGLLLFLAFLGILLKKLIRLRRTKPLVATLLIAIAAGMLVQGLVVDVLHWRHFWFMIAFIL